MALKESETISSITLSDLDLKDEKFQIGNVSSYHLSVEISNNSFVWSILDKKENEVLTLSRIELMGIFNDSMLANKVSDLISNDAILLAFKHSGSVSVAYVSNKSTLVPKPLYQEENKEDYLRLTHGFDESEALLADDLKGVDAKNVYSLPKELKSAIHHAFPNARVIHFSTSLLENLLLNQKNQIQKNVFLNFRKERFDVVVIFGKELLFNNSFRFETKEDIAYYTLFVFEQLKLNPEETLLTLMGEIERTADAYALLYKYVRQIEFANRSERYKYSYKLDTLPRHFFYTLLSQSACVL